MSHLNVDHNFSFMFGGGQILTGFSSKGHSSDVCRKPLMICVHVKYFIHLNGDMDISHSVFKVNNFSTHVTSRITFKLERRGASWGFVETVLAAEMDVSIYETCLTLPHISEQDVIKPSSVVTCVLILQRAGDPVLLWP